MGRIEALRSLVEGISDARYWVEICYEDDCEAFRDHARSIIRQIARELPMVFCEVSPKLLPLSDPLPDGFTAIMHALGRAYACLGVGLIHQADEALQDALEHLRAEIVKEVCRHGEEERVVSADRNTDSSGQGTSD